MQVALKGLTLLLSIILPWLDFSLLLFFAIEVVLEDEAMESFFFELSASRDVVLSVSFSSFPDFAISGTGEFGEATFDNFFEYSFVGSSVCSAHSSFFICSSSLTLSKGVSGLNFSHFVGELKVSS